MYCCQVHRRHLVGIIVSVIFSCCLVIDSCIRLLSGAATKRIGIIQWCNVTSVARREQGLNSRTRMKTAAPSQECLHHAQRAFEASHGSFHTGKSDSPYSVFWRDLVRPAIYTPILPRTVALVKGATAAVSSVPAFDCLWWFLSSALQQQEHHLPLTRSALVNGSHHLRRWRSEVQRHSPHRFSVWFLWKPLISVWKKSNKIQRKSKKNQTNSNIGVSLHNQRIALKGWG